MAKIMLLKSRNLTFSRETRAGDVVSYSFFSQEKFKKPKFETFHSDPTIFARFTYSLVCPFGQKIKADELGINVPTS